MARPSYNVPSASVYHESLPNGSNPSSTHVVDGWRGQETVSGTDRMKPKGWVPPTGYSLTSIEYRRAHGTMNMLYDYNTSYGLKSWGCVGGGRFNSLNHFNELILESNCPDASLENAALIGARANLKQMTVNLGVAWAERGRTATLVGDTAKRIGGAYYELRRGRVRNAMNMLGVTSSRREPRGSNVPKKWLELQYGWKPLLSDVYGACDALRRRPYSDWSVTAKGSRTSQRLLTKTWSEFEAGYGTASVWNGAFVRIDAIPTSGATISLASVGILNPLAVAWELVPYSFVVDWFIPIGGWLDSLDAHFGYSGAYTSSTLLTRVKWEEVGRTHRVAPWTYENSYYGYKKMTRMVRSVSSGVAMPAFPRPKSPWSLGHMANGLALLSQAFGRRS